MTTISEHKFTHKVFRKATKVVKSRTWKPVYSSRAGKSRSCCMII